MRRAGARGRQHDRRQARRLTPLTSLLHRHGSEDLARANEVAERMVAGNSWINAHNVFAYGLPYGGVNLSGFGGGVNSPQTYFDYVRHQTIARPLGSPAIVPMSDSRRRLRHHCQTAPHGASRDRKARS